MEKFTLREGIVPSHRYKTDKGEISLLYPSCFTFDEFEIFCIDGDLFEDIERYPTLEQAESRIKELLVGHG